MKIYMKTFSPLAKLFIFSFLIHLLVTLLIHYFHFYPFGNLDDLYYHETAVGLAEQFRQGNFSLSNFSLPNYYPVYLGIIYALFGPFMLIGKAIGIILSSLTAVIIYLIIRELNRSKKIAFLIALLSNFYPSYLYYSSLLLKDTLVVPLSLFGLWLIIKLIKKIDLKILIIFFLNTLALFYIRNYTAVILFLTFFLSLLISKESKDFRKILTFPTIILITCFFPYFLGYGYFGFNFFSRLLNPETITQVRETVYSIGGSAVGLNLDFSTFFTFLKTYFLSFTNVLLGPLPWQMKTISTQLAAIETIPWYFLLFFIIKGLLKSSFLKASLPLLIFGLGLIAAIAFFSDNLGANTRLRMAAFLSLFCLLPLVFPRISVTRIPRINTNSANSEN